MEHVILSVKSLSSAKNSRPAVFLSLFIAMLRGEATSPL